MRRLFSILALQIVAVVSALAAVTYSITIMPMEYGAVTCDVTAAQAGETVTLTVNPAEGYALATLMVDERATTGDLDDDDAWEPARSPQRAPVAITDGGDGTYTFVMPAVGVKVSATFAPITPIYYHVLVDDNSRATIVADADRAEMGQTVTLSITPIEGYVVDHVTVTTVNVADTSLGDDDAWEPARSPQHESIAVDCLDECHYAFDMPASSVKVVVTVAAEVTLSLADLLTVGNDGGHYRLSDALTVVGVIEDAGCAYATDGNDNWVRIAGAPVAGLEEGLGIDNVRGVLSMFDTAPTLELVADVTIVMGMDYDLRFIDLSGDVKSLPKPCQVVKLRGCYDGAKLCGWPSASTANEIAIDTSHCASALDEGTYYDAVVGIELVEPWESEQGVSDDGGNQAPARVRASDADALDNLRAIALSSDATSIVTGIAEINADGGKVIYHDLGGHIVGTTLSDAPRGVYVGSDGTKVIKDGR